MPFLISSHSKSCYKQNLVKINLSFQRKLLLSAIVFLLALLAQWVRLHFLVSDLVKTSISTVNNHLNSQGLMLGIRGPLSLLKRLLEEGHSLVLNYIEFSQGGKIILTQSYHTAKPFSFFSSIGIEEVFVYQLGDYLARGSVTPSMSYLTPILIESAFAAGLAFSLAHALQWYYRLRFEETLISRKSEMARQVSHDIRSPLSALNMIVRSLNDIPQDKRSLIEKSCERINQIAEDLLREGKAGEAPALSQAVKRLAKESCTDKEEKNKFGPMSSAQHEPEMIASLLQDIFLEKSAQFAESYKVELKLNIKFSYGLFARVNPTDFLRVISNLINNSYEALASSENRVIEIALRGYTSQIVVSISDTGPGIPPDILPHLGNRQLSLGKQGTSSGSGLGLFHAKKTVESIGGRFTIRSQSGVGTLVEIALPRVASPLWCLEVLDLPKRGRVFFLADDTLTHEQMKIRLQVKEAQSNEVQSNQILFSSILTADPYYREASSPLQCILDEIRKIEQLDCAQTDHLGGCLSASSAENLYLVGDRICDGRVDALKLIEAIASVKSPFGGTCRTILVTSLFMQRDLQKRCLKIGCKILPKTMISLVPIREATLPSSNIQTEVSV